MRCLLSILGQIGWFLAKKEELHGCEKVKKLKVRNEELIGKLEAKNKELNELRSSRIEPKSLVQHQDIPGITYALPKVEEIRKMEADLKRKSDLLTEVKVLLKQAADRERAMIGKKEHALKKYDQFALNTSCFWGSIRSNITPVVQFHEIFVTKIMNKLIYYYYY